MGQLDMKEDGRVCFRLEFGVVSSMKFRDERLEVCFKVSRVISVSDS